MATTPKSNLDLNICKNLDYVLSFNKVQFNSGIA